MAILIRYYFTPFYRWWRWGIAKSNNSPKITQLGRDRTRIEPQKVWFQRLYLKHHPKLCLKLAAQSTSTEGKGLTPRTFFISTKQECAQTLGDPGKFGNPSGAYTWNRSGGARLWSPLCVAGRRLKSTEGGAWLWGPGELGSGSRCVSHRTSFPLWRYQFSCP